MTNLTPLKAIKLHCQDCSGDDNPKKKKKKNCPLYVFRLGFNPNAKREVSEEQKEKLLLNLRKRGQND